MVSTIEANEIKAVSTPLLGTQHGIWLADLVEQNKNLYTIAHAITISGKLDIARLTQAINIAMSHADTVNAKYSQQDAGPMQQLNALAIEQLDTVVYRDFSGDADPVGAARGEMEHDLAQENLADGAGALYRHIIFNVSLDGEPKFIWYQRYHHIMLDGYSITELTKHVSNLYTGLISGQQTFSNPYVSTKAVVAEYQDYLESAKYLKDGKFWQEYCRDFSEIPSLARNGQSLLAGQLSANVWRKSFALTSKQKAQLEAIAQLLRVAFNDLVFALIYLYLYKVSGQNQQVVGVPFMRRLGSVAAQSTAPVVNVLPVKLHIQEQDSLIDTAKGVAQALKKVRKHQRYDADQIHRDCKPKVNMLYRTMINYKMFDYELSFDGVEGKTEHLAAGPVDDIEFAITLDKQQINIEISAQSKRYDVAEVELHLARLQQLSEKLINDFNMPVSEVNYLCAEEKSDLQQYQLGKCISISQQQSFVLNQFYQTVNKVPEDTALVFGSDRLTYLQLAQRAKFLAEHLVRQGAKPNDVIAVALPRSLDSIISILAIFQIGAVYLPVDIGVPAERIAMICEDAQPVLAIVHSDIELSLPKQLSKVEWSENKYEQVDYATSAEQVTLFDHVSLDAEQAAYIIFTSGSTGRPKGVEVSHRALANLYHSHCLSIFTQTERVFKDKGQDRQIRAAHTTSFAFDAAWEQVLWMVYGAQLHLVDDELRKDAFELSNWISNNTIDALDLPPSMLAQMLENGLAKSTVHTPSVILTGSEAVPASLWQQLQQLDSVLVFNCYGPTEYTVDALFAQVNDSDVPVIGRPVANTKALVLDAKLNQVGIGVTGELYLAGKGIANKYIANEATTANRFIAEPGNSGELMYRTGDLVRWLASGQLEYLGRSDDQVKIRGFRLELGEVERALEQIEGVELAVVTVYKQHNIDRLIGYCRVDEKTLGSDSQGEIKHQLSRKLPDYMVPSAIVILEEFPMNVSGKINKAQLPQVDFSSKSVRAPSTHTQLIICKAMQKVLHLGQLSIDDDFFTLGGDSITAIVLSTELRKLGWQLKPSEVFAEKTPELMAECLVKIDAGSDENKVRSGEVFNDEYLVQVKSKYPEAALVSPLLPLQQGMLFHSQLEGNAGSYNSCSKLFFKGDLNVDKLQQALNQLMVKYPQLAGVFDATIVDQPLLILPSQTHTATTDWPIEHFYLHDIPVADQASAINKIETDLTTRQYLSNRWNNLVHCGVVHHGDNEHIVFLVIHHLMVDGWSTPLLLRDLLNAYRQPTAILAPTKDDYVNVVAQLAERDLTSATTMWQQALTQISPTLLFEDISDSASVEEHMFTLSEPLTKALTQRLREQGLTLNVMMQALWGIVLKGLTLSKSVTFGTPVSGRTSQIDSIEEQVGLFLNTIPVSVALDPNKPIWQQLAQMQEVHMSRLNHDELGLSDIQALAGGTSLFDTLLVVENYPDSDYLGYSLPDLELSDIDNRGYSHYPLALLVMPGQELTFLVENRGAITDVQSFGRRIEQLLTQIIEQPDITISQLHLLLPSESKLINEVNDTEHSIPQITLQQALVQQAEKTPHQMALYDDQHQLTYSEVRRQVCTLSQQLVEAGVKQGDLVAVALERSVRLSIAILAIIETGAAYLPLELAYPDQRLNFIIEDAAPKLTITSSDQVSRFENNSQPLLFDRLFTSKELQETSLGISYQATLEQTAYVIYTSGTTGKPKGAAISHQAIVNRILWMQGEYQLTEDDTVLQKTPCGFDVSVWEFFWALMVGAKLVMAKPEVHKDPRALLQTIEDFNVTTMHFVPSMLAVFVDAVENDKTGLLGKGNSLRLVFCSGEALPKNLSRSFNNLFQAQLHNLYGPTEAAIDVTYQPANELSTIGEGGVAIGLPVWNTQVHVLDQYLNQVPIGQSGELYLSGVQLASEYLSRPELTSTRFVADPFSQGLRMYRTGDLVRRLGNGAIEYIGRTDHQLKIRGQRIELGEIETVLQNLDGVRHAVVEAKVVTKQQSQADERQLVAYLVVEQELELNQVKRAITQDLPEHMVPNHFVFIDELPLSANGKLDRKALPLPDISQSRDSLGRAAEPGMESDLALVFAGVLGIEDIKAEDDFFALGGHSIMAMRLAAEIRQKVNIEVTVGQIMVAPTVAKLAELISGDNLATGQAAAGFDQMIPLRTGEGSPLVCIYPASGFAWQYSGLSKYLLNDQPIIGLQSPRPTGGIATSKDMEELCDKQLDLLLSIQPEGPYYLLGYSLGGNIAYGLAVRLEKLGHEVKFLGLLDTYPPEDQEWDDPDGAAANEGAEKEQEQFINDAMGDLMDDTMRREKEQMFGHIFQNYQDAVELLATASTPNYGGKVTLFVAEQSLPEELDVEECWQRRVGELDVHRLIHCSHEDIVSPESLQILGPLLDGLIERK